MPIYVDVSAAVHGRAGLGRYAESLGRALVADTLNFFFRRAGVSGVTVNTQQDNLASQHLYERMGFRPTGNRVPVWTLRL